MSSDTASIRAEIETLWSTAIDLAREKLEKEGEFFPFGLSIAIDHDPDDDELDLLEASGDEGEINEEEAVDALVQHFGEEHGNFRAVAVVFDSMIDDEWDAITVLVAHVQGESVDVQQPYRVSGTKRLWGEVELSEGSLAIWDA